MKAMVTVGFTGERDAFVDAMIATLNELVGSGAASRASVDVRLPDAEIAQLGEALLVRQDEQAVVALWDTGADVARRLALPATARMVGAYEVQEIVKKDYTRTWPSGARSPGFKMIAFLHRRDDLSRAAFSAHWRDRHGPLAVARQPGFWHYVQNHMVTALTDSSPEWDGIGEIHYRTVDDAVHKSYDSEEAQQLIWEDVARFLAYDRSPTLTTNEWVVGP